MVDGCGRHQRAQELGDLFPVHHAHVDVRIGVLVGEHVVDHQPGQIAVLQVLEFFLEHGGLQLAVAVDQREGAARLARQHGLHDRQDGRDAAAARDAHVMPPLLRLDRHEEAPLRRHHADRVAGLEVFVDPVGEHAARDLAHAHAQLAVVDTGADGVRAAQVLAGDFLAQREVLALREAEDGTQVLRHVEGDDDGLGRVRLDGTDLQGVEQGAHVRLA